MQAGISDVIFWVPVSCGDCLELLPELWQPGRSSRHKDIEKSHPAKLLLKPLPFRAISMVNRFDVDAKVGEPLIQGPHQHKAATCFLTGD